MKNAAIFATRAEELGNKVFDYFAMPPQDFYSRLLKDKAAVLVGGRGTGKTMLFKSLAMEYKILDKNNEEASQQWTLINYIGCYIRIDTNIVASFKGRGISNWGEIFAHYFNLRVVQQIVKTLKILLNKEVFSSDELIPFIERYYDIIDEEGKPSLLNMEKSVRRKLDELIRYINNPGKREVPELINNGTLIFELCNEIVESTPFIGKTWFILLDEFENLNIDQQRIVNTLIKANQPPVIFKIAMRTGGWWTQQTLATTESLEEIADFDLLDYQTDLSESEYKMLIVEAFNKSLQLNGVKNGEFLDIRNLLPDLSPEDEARYILEKSTKKIPPFMSEIKNIIESHVKDSELQKNYINELIIKDNPLITRFHLILFKRGYTIERIVKLKNENPNKYNELYRHNKIGALFLLVNEYKTKKIYAGFETFVLLSSKIMRNFVSIFSRAWELSVDEGFSVNQPKPFNFKVQSKAAHDVSRGKVFEIESYPTIGHLLSSFTNQIGRIFEGLNKDERQSQPERNHFSIQGDLSAEAKDLLRGALMFSVFQEVVKTKVRNIFEARDRDFMINRIYCPYYNISVRKMHKLELTSSDIESLLLGNDDARRNTSNNLLVRYNDHLKIEQPEIKQLDLFDI
ncbi:hypothetical protein BGM25_08270 [Bacillus sp. FJAT-29953]|nr:hypothetical protein [Bacillus sp. FJAT-29953]